MRDCLGANAIDPAGLDNCAIGDDVGCDGALPLICHCAR
jgi:hypothetical protein